MALFDDILGQEGPVRGFFDDLLTPNPPYPVERVPLETGATRPDTDANIVGGLTIGDLATGALRYGVPLLASTGGPIGAVAAGVGETGAQILEKARHGTELRPQEIALEAALGAIPFGKASKVFGKAPVIRRLPRMTRGAISGAVEGASFAAGSSAVRDLVQQGELRDPSSYITPALLGGALGGLAGRARTGELIGDIKRDPDTGESVFLYRDSNKYDIPAIAARSPDSDKLDIAVKGNDVMARPKGITGVRSQNPFGLNEAEDLDSFARQITEYETAGLKGGVAEAAPKYLRILATKAIEDPANALRIRDTDAYRKGMRFNRQVLEELRRTPSGIDKVDRMLEDIYTSVESTISKAGMANQTMSQVRRSFNTFIDDMLGNLEEKPSLARKINDLRRSLLVTQLTTSVRNFVSNAGRLTLDGVEQAFAELVTGHPIRAAKTLGRRALAMGQVGAKLGRGGFGQTASQARTAGVLDEHRFWERRLYEGTLSGGEAFSNKGATGKLAEAAQWFNLRFNKNGESLWRATAFDISLREQLERAGYNVAQSMQNPKDIPAMFVQNAVDKALELTFAQAPQGRAARVITNAINSTPLSAVVPFPRFMVNGFKLITDHNPSGMLKLFYGKAANGQFLAADPAKRVEMLAKSAAGTALLAGAMALRESEYAAPEWNKIKLDDGRVIDLLPYAPFSGFLFLAHLVDEMGTKGNLNDVPLESWREGLLAMNRLGGLGMAFTNLFAGTGDTGTGWENIKTGIGEYLSGFTVPFLTIKDMLPMVGRAAPQLEELTGQDFSEEALRRDVREDPIFGPVRSNLPFGGKDLPKRFDPISGRVRQSERGAPRQFTGLNIVDRDPITDKLLELGIEPYKVGPRLKGDRPESRVLQRATERALGPLIQKEVPAFVESPSFNAMPKELQKIELKKFIAQLRGVAEDEALSLLLRENPDFEDIATFSDNPSSIPDYERKRRAHEALGLSAR